MSRGCSSLVIAEQCFHSNSISGAAIVFQQFSRRLFITKIQTCPKVIVKDIDATDRHWAQPRWPLSSCQDSIWHICAPLHVILARALVNQPDLHSIDYFCHSFPRGFIQDSSCSTMLHPSRTYLLLLVHACLVSMTNIKCCCQAFQF